jgi:hypothetical protein
VNSPSQGWYPDPDDASRVRFWDGVAWSGSSRSASWKPPRAKSALRIVGVILAVVLGLLGLGVVAFFIFITIAFQNFGSNK